ncbi:GerMN domain-containing protein [Microbacterium sp. SSW1-49]|uniref:GerMN domain-containing protein n=1 Tax=Microbacterium croceum TaxID=2851645 RepID=A0ABT0FE59_9MICO|nr:GerMN domain-containing protein [Microbacterium croceum]MCK2036357.1 GerMN domain-containing protein [Microbacterium croceum]
MIHRRDRRMLRVLALAAAALLLPACAGLPTSGDVNVGLELGEAPEDNDILFIASGPAPGASPQEIVEGFLEAAITPAENWSIARTFLTPELQPTWRPGVGVSVDTAVGARTMTSTIPDEGDEGAEDATSGDVTVQFDLVANVDESGAYSESVGASTATFTVERLDDGEWRIAKAPDGIVIDESRFSLVFDGYPLQYFDHDWSHLVPDVRWFPRRTSIATTVTQALINGSASPWLEQSVQSAFPADVQLAEDAVPIGPEQVAEVALTGPDTRLNQTTLARMRTQLQATFEASGVHVSQVRFTLDGRPLNAGIVKLSEETIDPGSLVLTDDAFGAIVGDQIAPIPGISDEILGLSQEITAIDVAADSSHAAVHLADGRIYLAGNGRMDELDTPATTVSPSIDPFGYTWTVPSNDPGAVQAWGSDASPNAVATAWSNASAISAMRVSSDGSRVAAVVTVGGQYWVVVAAIVRENGVPVELGPVKQLTRIDGAADDLVWLGPTRLGVLIPGEGSPLLTQMVGGPGTAEAAPADAVSLAGSRTIGGVRVLNAESTLFAHAGSAWREIASDVRVLATRAGE